MAFTITDSCTGCGACARVCPTNAISGEKKQPHTIDPSVCIDCGACGRACPKGAIEDDFGKTCERVKKSDRKKPIIDEELCCACTVCVETCPAGCLDMSDTPGRQGPDAYPYLYDEKSCISCGFCADECPLDAITMATVQKATNV